ncbi:MULTISPECIES: hypothetical protein [Brachybacterium]|uniref:Replicase polyprotein 1ab n=2 Tax=Brachybacterium TaxID=43668 RepID=A0A3R8QST5_9MICO|nr:MULTISPECIES: hypothetical protein [Brachybacterium]MCT1436388.1 hypothetical protein [Brachybacterium paraconglomeratum]RRR17079.1 hypothetical protein DS079_15960 [Brachybacterium paraconglomeratum]GLI31666.1 hypothetical protein BCONGLO52_25070 [Brachybacterium conglomeratum]GLK06378.1 hypothetical protein GCM10017597_31780 [Brachybacterium conglomeratum]
MPEGVTGRELDKETHEELRGLSKETAERVGRHLVSAHLLEDSDPETALAHARFAARLGGRVGIVREVYGIFAYHAGDYRTASRELRTAMRITGRTDVLPMIADCERGLGRPERALDIAASEEAAALGVESAIELMMVVAGAYADTGDVQTALRTLEIPALRHKIDGRWQVRLWVAYADLLERADREDEARRWMTLAADADTEGLTDAAERLGRPAPAPAEAPVLEGDEQISVLDAFDPYAQDEQDGADDAEDGDAPVDAGADADAVETDDVDGTDDAAEAADDTEDDDAEVAEGDDAEVAESGAAEDTEGDGAEAGDATVTAESADVADDPGAPESGTREESA